LGEAVTEENFGELEAAWARAEELVPLATSRITFFRPYSSERVSGRYDWEPHGLLRIHLGLPGLGGQPSIATERQSEFAPLGDYYIQARHTSPSTSRRISGLFRTAGKPKEWIHSHVGTENLLGYTVHERAHGQAHEASVLLPDFEARMHAALAGAVGVEHAIRPILRGRSKTELNEHALSGQEQLRLRMAVADEFGAYASSTERLHTPGWNELWPSMVTLASMAPEKTGEITEAMRPLREEIAAIPEDRQRLYLYGRLNAAKMSDGDVDLLREHHFDLYVVAEARSGRVGVDDARDLMAEARDRGVELDTAYLRSSTPMREHLAVARGGQSSSAREPRPATTASPSAVTRGLMEDATHLVDTADVNRADSPSRVQTDLSGDLGVAN
jgi:hypothetical protein